MKNEKNAIKRLTNFKSKVSSHYLIKKDGKVIILVPDLYTAWHAGVSSWKSFKSLNKYSIGIEISNPGHNYKYIKFTKEQIKSVVKLSKLLIKKYKIRSEFILGHSDISPDRKRDPGEKFPWHYLSKNKIGYWHNLNQKKLLKDRYQKISKTDKFFFFENLYKIGYAKHFNKKNSNYLKLLTCSFQRRFRQDLIDGIIDKECLNISINLVKNLNNFS